MRSIGARLALWYALATAATMICAVLAGRYFLESYAVHSLDLLNEDEFQQIKSHLRTDYAQLSPEQMQERLERTSANESVLFFVAIDKRGEGTMFLSQSLNGNAIPDVKGKRVYDAVIPGVRDKEVRVGEFLLGPLDITIATSKQQVHGLMEGYTTVFLTLGAAMLVVSAVIGFLLSGYALRPLRLIQKTANQISSDNLSERIPVPAGHDEISNLARLLNQTFDRLESSFNQIRRFSAEASHELKTPLSLVRLQAEKLLVEGGLSPAQEESVQVQLEEISRLNQIIEELLFLSRAESRAITLVTCREDPRRFLQNFTQDARVLAENQGVQFAEAITGRGLVDFDPRWIRQVLLNLVSNALNVSPRGSTVRLSSELSRGFWRVTVEDEGPGVPKEQRERIFERFVRLEQPDGNQQEKGSGLGLAISRSIVGLHHGKISAEAAGRGTGLRVVFQIPAVGAGAPAEKDGGKHAPGGPRDAEAPHRSTQPVQKV